MIYVYKLYRKATQLNNADYPFLQTAGSVEYANQLKDYAQTEVYNMLLSADIWNSSRTFTNGWKIPASFSDIGVPSSALTSKFATFKNNYNNQGGTVVQNEHNAALANAIKVR